MSASGSAMDFVMIDAASPSRAKRSRSCGSGKSGAAGCRLADCAEDALTDNLRSQKRYLSEVMASNLSRLNMAPGASRSALRARDTSCDSSPMQTDRCASPARSQEGEATSCPAGASPLSTGSRSSFKSPRQKGVTKASTSPLKAGWPYARPPRGPGSAGARQMGPVAAATAAAKDTPPSPSDSHASMDLRRAALLRSVLHRREGSGLAATATSKPHPGGQQGGPAFLEVDSLPTALRPSLGRECESPSPTGARLGLAFTGLGFTSPVPKAHGGSRHSRGGVQQPASEPRVRWRGPTG